MVIHSYSGIPGGQALEGLDKKSRSERGLQGSVIRLIYVLSFIVPEGFQQSARGTKDKMVPVMKTDFEVDLHISFLHNSPIITNIDLIFASRPVL